MRVWVLLLFLFRCYQNDRVYEEKSAKTVLDEYPVLSNKVQKKLISQVSCTSVDTIQIIANTQAILPVVKTRDAMYLSKETCKCHVSASNDVDKTSDEKLIHRA